MSSINARTVGVALGIDLGIGIACFSLFSILRIIRPTNRYYDPRTHYQSHHQHNATQTTTTGSSSSSRTDSEDTTSKDQTTSNPVTTTNSSSRVNPLTQAPVSAAAAGSSALELHGMPRPGMPLPPQLPRTLLTWIWPLLRTPEQAVINAVGLDVAMLLRFIRFAIKLLLLLIIWCVGVVLPVNYTGRALATNSATVAAAAQQLAAMSPEQAAALRTTTTDNTQNDNFLSVIFPSINIPQEFTARGPNRTLGGGDGVINVNNSTGSGSSRAQLGPGVDIGSLAYMIENGLYIYSNLDLFSMANIPTGSRLLWVHLASVYVVTFLVLRMLWSATSSALQLYLHHLASSSANLDSASHTALVTDIPGIARGTIANKALHNPLLRVLLPAAARKQLHTSWRQLQSQQNVIRNKVVTRIRTASGPLMDLEQQQQQGFNKPAAAAAVERSHGSVTVHIPVEVLSQDDNETEQQQQQQQQQWDADHDNDDVITNGDYITPQSLTSYPVSSLESAEFHNIASGSSSSTSKRNNSSSIRRRTGRSSSNTGSPPTAAAGSANEHVSNPSSSSSSDALITSSPSSPPPAAAAAAAPQPDSPGVGGIGVFSNEWRAAAAAVEKGMPLKDYILREFRSIYGPSNVIDCHLVTWTPRAAALVQQYNAARTALEDLITSYIEQINAATAAAARSGGGGGDHPHHHHHMREIKIRKLAYPKGKKQQKQIGLGSMTPAAAAAVKVVGSSSGNSRAVSPDHVVVMTTCSTPDSDLNRADAQSAAVVQDHHQQQQQQQALAPASATAAEAAAESLDSTTPGACCWGRHAGVRSSRPHHSSSTAQAISSSRPLHTTTDSSNSSSRLGVLHCFRRAEHADALEVLLWQLEDIRQKLQAEQAQADKDPSPAAFVTFRTRTSLTAAISSHHTAEAGSWRVSSAPPPDSLIWGKLGLRFWELGLRRGLVYSVLIVLAITYVVPIAVIQGLLQLDRLRELPVIGALVTLPVVQSLLVGVLPGLALRIFVLLLPVILFALNRRAGPKGDAELDGAVATHFFFLQVVVVFLASFITGSLLNQLQLFVTNGLAPILDRLGAGVPQTASFFILYIIFTAFIGRSWGLLRPWGLLMTSIRVMSARKNGRNARRRAVIVGTYRMFGPAIPEHSIILLLGIVFSVLAPLVLVAAVIFFGMALLVESYNWVWVFRRPYEGGGRLWKQLFRHVFIALYLFQAVMAALLIVKRFVWTPLMIPAFLLTLLVQHIGSRLLQRSWDILAMKAAHYLDLDDQREAVQMLKQQQQQQQQQGLITVADQSARLSDDVDGVSELEALYRSQAVSWSQMYRPPAVQLLDQAEAVQSDLRNRVTAVQVRLAEHNAAAVKAAEEARRRRQYQQQIRQQQHAQQ